VGFRANRTPDGRARIGCFQNACSVGSDGGRTRVHIRLARIAWIVVGSIFLYNVASETGQFQVMKESIAGLSSDKRLQLVLIAFCFGAFLEGTGGGGAPVAIAGAFLMGLGFSPFQSATLCLLANTAPVAWGGVGNPIRTLGGVTGLSELQFSAMAEFCHLSLILPFWLVRSMVGWRETFQVWPALLVSGLSLQECNSTGRTTRISGWWTLLPLYSRYRDNDVHKFGNRRR
jgi:L-lactate permease